MDLITANVDPYPQPLSQAGRGTLKLLAPLRPTWEKGLVDEGKQGLCDPLNPGFERLIAIPSGTH